MSELDVPTQRRQRLRNLAQGVLLLGGMAAILGALAWLLFGPAGLLWLVAFGVTAALFRPHIPADWVLSMYGATRLPEHAAPELHRWVRVLADRAELPEPPKLYYIASPVLNALAVGSRDDPALAVTDGLLRHLTGRELVGVIAHEISHIKSNDLWIMNLSDTVGRLTHLLAYLGLFILVLTVPVTMGGTFWPLVVGLALMLTPTIITLLQLALARSREYDGDLEAAGLTGDPAGLASALQTLERHGSRIWERLMLQRRRTPGPLLLRTHPPTEERVRRLLSLVPEHERERLDQDVRFAPRDRPRVDGPARLRFPGVWW